MDADLISYESMLAARDSANWAFWGMVAAFCSTGVTLFAAIVAYRAISVWKLQDKAVEIKKLKLSVFRFQMKITFSRNMFASSNKPQHQVDEAFSILKSLDEVYEGTLTFHNKVLRNQASEIYNEISLLVYDYLQGKINNQIIIDRIVEIRKEDKLLNTSL
ncbi:Uncharacterised protein [Serratia liquefaciens]|uniref:hypothetical protein n=1 Tax=Serratia liquefaciens TaxID=614 RepID=UPI002183C30A|nr:hypothetical protein [Serratia liquefaciens]CAI2449111.1 Uncharacterised protein [Serratia liquefaciens]